jgi:small subunit ribosomal protein S1
MYQQGHQFMAKMSKEPKERSEEPKAKSKPVLDDAPVKKAVKGAAAEDLFEKDELTELKLEKKAAEEEGISRMVKDVTARRSATSNVSLENFDWDAFDTKGFGEGYSKNERNDLDKLYGGTIASVNESEVVEGTVVGINDRDVILNIGFKSDGLVPLAEFKDMVNLKIGDVVDLFIEERENAMGQLVLSRRKAKLVKGWDYVQRALDKDEVIEGFVKRRTKGGLILARFTN